MQVADRTGSQEGRRKAGFALRFVLLPLFLLAIDQLTKVWVTSNLELGEEISLIPGFFNIRYVVNEGAALGIFENMTLFLVGISVLMIIFLYVLAVKDEEEGHSVIPELLIIGGAFGNLADRVFLGGAVRDFLEVPFFAIMNFADWFVSVGIALLVLKYIYYARKQPDSGSQLEDPAAPDQEGTQE